MNLLTSLLMEKSRWILVHGDFTVFETESPPPATFQQGFAYVIYFPLVQLCRYYTGKYTDLIWHSLLKEKRHNVFDTHYF